MPKGLLSTGFFFGALMSACGGENVAPIISDLVMTSSVALGEVGTGRLDLFDPDGVQGGTLQLAFTGPMNLSLDVPVRTPLGDHTTVQAQFHFLVQESGLAGIYSVAIQARDFDDAVSNTLEGSFEAR